MRTWCGRCLGALLLLCSTAAFADDGRAPTPNKPAQVDRVAVRWASAETGGSSTPQFILERELGFEARLEALSERGDGAVLERHIRSAMDRHIAESMLAALTVAPAASARDVAQVAEAARRSIEDRIGGGDALREAAAAEGLSLSEVDSVFRRRARASLYLDRMVAPLMRPSEADMKNTFRNEEALMAGITFEEARASIRRRLVAERTAQALDTFLQLARSRVTVWVRRR